jgi:hypothetical protein
MRFLTKGSMQLDQATAALVKAKIPVAHSQFVLGFCTIAFGPKYFLSW